MVSTQARENVAEKWKLPLWLQELIAALMVPLLMASLYGWLSIRDSINTLDAQHRLLEKDVAVLATWKTEFGRQERFGKDDADDMKDELKRMRNKLDLLTEAYNSHISSANTYIEKIQRHEKDLDLLMDNLYKGINE